MASKLSEAITRVVNTVKEAAASAPASSSGSTAPQAKVNTPAKINTSSAAAKAKEVLQGAKQAQQSGKPGAISSPSLTGSSKGSSSGGSSGGSSFDWSSINKGVQEAAKAVAPSLVSSAKNIASAAKNTANNLGTNFQRHISELTNTTGSADSQGTIGPPVPTTPSRSTPNKRRDTMSWLDIEGTTGKSRNRDKGTYLWEGHYTEDGAWVNGVWDWYDDNTNRYQYLVTQTNNKTWQDEKTINSFAQEAANLYWDYDEIGTWFRDTAAERDAARDSMRFSSKEEADYYDAYTDILRKNAEAADEMKDYSDNLYQYFAELNKWYGEYDDSRLIDAEDGKNYKGGNTPDEIRALMLQVDSTYDKFGGRKSHEKTTEEYEALKDELVEAEARQKEIEENNRRVIAGRKYLYTLDDKLDNISFETLETLLDTAETDDERTYIQSYIDAKNYYSYVDKWTEASDEELRTRLNQLEYGTRTDPSTGVTTTGKTSPKEALKEYSFGGNVDLTKRPTVDASKLSAAGWTDVGEGQATVFSSTYSNAKGDKAGNFTPIVVDSKGKLIDILSPSHLQKYAEAVLSGEREDNLGLQIGATFEGKDAIGEATKTAEKIHDLYEQEAQEPEGNAFKDFFSSLFSSAKDVIESPQKRDDLSREEELEIEAINSIIYKKRQKYVSDQLAKYSAEFPAGKAAEQWAKDARENLLEKQKAYQAAENEVRSEDYEHRYDFAFMALNAVGWDWSQITDEQLENSAALRDLRAAGLDPNNPDIDGFLEGKRKEAAENLSKAEEELETAREEYAFSQMYSDYDVQKSPDFPEGIEEGKKIVDSYGGMEGLYEALENADTMLDKAYGLKQAGITGEEAAELANMLNTLGVSADYLVPRLAPEGGDLTSLFKARDEEVGTFTDTQLKHYYYLLGTEGIVAASEYAIGVNSILNKEYIDQRHELYLQVKDMEMRHKSGVGRVAQILADPWAGGLMSMTGIADTIKYADQIDRLGRTIVADTPSLSERAEWIGESAHQQIEKYVQKPGWRDTWSFLYDAYSSAVQSAETQVVGSVIANGLLGVLGLSGTAMMPSFGGSAAGKTVHEFIAGAFSDLTFFGSAAASTYRELTERGIDPEDALNMSLFSGVAEAAFEHISFEQLYHAKDVSAWNSWLDVARETIISGGIEGSEELFTNWANHIGQTLFIPENTDYWTKYYDYKYNRGFSDEKAKQLATHDIVMEDALAFFSGAVSSSMSVTPTHVVSYSVSKNNSEKTRTEIGNRYSAYKDNSGKSGAQLLGEYLKGYTFIEDGKESLYTKDQVNAAKNVQTLATKAANGTATAEEIGKLHELADSLNSKAIDEFVLQNGVWYAGVSGGRLWQVATEANVLLLGEDEAKAYANAVANNPDARVISSFEEGLIDAGIGDAEQRTQVATFVKQILMGDGRLSPEQIQSAFQKGGLLSNSKVQKFVFSHLQKIKAAGAEFIARGKAQQAEAATPVIPTKDQFEKMQISKANFSLPESLSQIGVRDETVAEDLFTALTGAWSTARQADYNMTLMQAGMDAFKKELDRAKDTLRNDRKESRRAGTAYKGSTKTDLSQYRNDKDSVTIGDKTVTRDEFVKGYLGGEDVIRGAKITGNPTAAEANDLFDMLILNNRGNDNFEGVKSSSSMVDYDLEKNEPFKKETKTEKKQPEGPKAETDSGVEAPLKNKPAQADMFDEDYDTTADQPESKPVKKNGPKAVPDSGNRTSDAAIQEKLNKLQAARKAAEEAGAGDDVIKSLDAKIAELTKTAATGTDTVVEETKEEPAAEETPAEETSEKTDQISIEEIPEEELAGERPTLDNGRTVYGDKGEVYVSGTESVPFTYAIVSADDLVASHDAYGTENPNYPQELQARERSRTESVIEANKIANDLNPVILTDSHLAQNGAPIVRNDGVVVSGNGRTMALEILFGGGSERAKAKAKEYVDYIRSVASKFGIDTSNLPDKPVLVRVVESAKNWVDLAKKANTSTVMAYSATEQSRVDSEALLRHPEVLSEIVLSEDGSLNLNSPDNRDFILSFRDSVIPEGERNDFMTADGNLSQSGIDRVKNAIFYAAYGDNTLQQKLSEDTDPDNKNILKALLISAGSAVNVKTAIQDGSAYDTHIVDVVLGAVDLYASAKENKVSVESFVENGGKQSSLFEGREYSAEEVFLAQFIESEGKRSAPRLALFANMLYNGTIELGDPNQESLFQATDTSLRGVVEDAAKKYEDWAAAENKKKKSEKHPGENLGRPDYEVYRGFEEIVLQPEGAKRPAPVEADTLNGSSDSEGDRGRGETSGEVPGLTPEEQPAAPLAGTIEERIAASIGYDDMDIYDRHNASIDTDESEEDYTPEGADSYTPEDVREMVDLAESELGDFETIGPQSRTWEDTVVLNDGREITRAEFVANEMSGMDALTGEDTMPVSGTAANDSFDALVDSIASDGGTVSTGTRTVVTDTTGGQFSMFSGDTTPAQRSRTSVLAAAATAAALENEILERAKTNRKITDDLAGNLNAARTRVEEILKKRVSDVGKSIRERKESLRSELRTIAQRLLSMRERMEQDSGTYIVYAKDYKTLTEKRSQIMKQINALDAAEKDYKTAKAALDNHRNQMYRNDHYVYIGGSTYEGYYQNAGNGTGGNRNVGGTGSSRTVSGPVGSGTESGQVGSGTGGRRTVRSLEEILSRKGLTHKGDIVLDTAGLTPSQILEDASIPSNLRNAILSALRNGMARVIIVDGKVTNNVGKPVAGFSTSIREYGVERSVAIINRDNGRAAQELLHETVHHMLAKLSPDKKTTFLRTCINSMFQGREDLFKATMKAYLSSGYDVAYGYEKIDTSTNDFTVPDALAYAIYEELVCDLYGGINRFSKNDALQNIMRTFLNDMQKEVNEIFEIYGLEEYSRAKWVGNEYHQTSLETLSDEGKAQTSLETLSDEGKAQTSAETKTQERRNPVETRESTNVTAPEKRKKGTVRFDGANDGTRTYDGVDVENLNKKQKAVVETAKILSDVLNLDFSFFHGPAGVGGFYRGGNTIYVNINSGMGVGNFNKVIAAGSLSHELTHWLQRTAPEDYNALRQYIADDIVNRKGQDELDRLIEQQQRWDGSGKMTRDAAIDEVVANACQTMLSNSKAISELAEQNRSLFEKIQEFLRELVNQIKAAFADVDIQDNAPIYEAARDIEESFDEVLKLWDKALLQAADKNRSEEDYKTNTEIGAHDLKGLEAAVDENGKPIFQIFAFEHDEPEYRELLTKWGGITDEDVDDLFETVDAAVKIIKEHLDELDYSWEVDIDDRGFSPVKPNSDNLYKVSLDFSTLCRKRILQGAIQNQLQIALDRALTTEEGIAIRDALIALQEEGKQIEVACAFCYVEAARMKSPAQIQKFLDNREEVLKDFFAGKDTTDTRERVKQAEANERQAIYEEFGLVKGANGITYDVRDKKAAPMKKLPTVLKDRIRAAKKAAQAGYQPTERQQKIIDTAKQMTIANFTTPEGLEDLAKHHEELFDAYTSFVRTATRSKGIENDVWWRIGDSQKISDLLIEQMNKENGIRSNSWSDLQVKHLMDYIAATIELAARGAKEHAYTKVPDYVDLMGLTGVMINMSLIPTREYNGTLAYDDVEGFVYKTAMDLRKKFPETAGTICIGSNDEQIVQLLASTDIDYVIPYHRSGMAGHIMHAMHIPTWDEYQNFQNEKLLDGEDAEENAKRYGVKLLKESDPLWHKGPKFSEWFDLEKARETTARIKKELKDQGKKGKYGVMTGGYIAMQEAAEKYKKLCAERGLAPKFSFGHGNFANEENYWKVLIDRKMVNNKTGDIIEQKPIKPIFKRKTIERILNEEIARYGTVKKDQNEATRRVTKAFLAGNIKAGMSSEAIAKVIQDQVDDLSITNITQSAEDLDKVQHQQWDSVDDIDEEIERIQDQIRDIQNAQWEANQNAKADPRVIAAQKRMWAAEDEKGYSGALEERIQYRRTLHQVKEELNAQIPEGDLQELADQIADLKRQKEELHTTFPITKADYKKLVDYFGTTEDPSVAGFILKDGKMLDFSGEKQYGDLYAGGRDIYHSEVADVINIPSKLSPRVEMVGNGNIRLVPEINGINLSAKPTAAQKDALRDYIDYYKGDVHIDIDNQAGRTLETFGYNPGTSSSKILADIDNYFNTGELPAPQSELGQYLPQYQHWDNDRGEYVTDTAIYIKDGHYENGGTIDFISEILDGRKKGETRNHKRLTRRWVGMAKNGFVYGRVRFGDPIVLTKDSPEYKDSMIEGTEYDIKDGETKYYYPVLDVEDLRDNPAPILRHGNYAKYQQWDNAYPELHPSLQARKDAAEDLQRRVQQFFQDIPKNNENYLSSNEIEDMMDLNLYNDYGVAGEMSEAEEIVQRLSDIARGQDPWEKIETWQLMEELAEHLSPTQQSSWFEERWSEDPEFTRWHLEHRPSLYYPGYKPGDLRTKGQNGFGKAMFNRMLEEEHLRSLIQDGTIDYRTRQEAAKMLHDLETKNTTWYQQWDEDHNDWAPEFYSKLDRVITDWTNGKGQKLPEKMSAQQVVGWLKGKGVKDEEIKWSGIVPYLEGKKTVTQADLQRVMAENEFHIETKVLGGKTNNGGPLKVTGVYGIGRDRAEEVSGTEWDLKNLATSIAKEEAERWGYDDYKIWAVWDPDRSGVDFKVAYQEDGMWGITETMFEAEPTNKDAVGARWSEYSLPGGSNYREILFRLQGSDYKNNASIVHWRKNAPGTIAHARVQDMTDENGVPVLFVEEIQSDLHNEGARKGFDAVPDVPFAGSSDTYHEYVMKHILRMAAEGGYGAVGWTTAQQQIDRWSDKFAEGYRIEYDQAIPKFMRKYGKQWGLTVEPINVEVSMDYSSLTNPGYAEVWGMYIDQEMVDSLLHEGQAKFSLAVKNLLEDDYGIQDLSTVSNEKLNETRDNLDQREHDAQIALGNIRETWNAKAYENASPEEYTAAYHEWYVSHSMPEYSEKVNLLQNAKKEIISEQDWRAIDADKLMNIAEDLYGTTYDFRRSGFILPNGKMLNMSENGYSRTEPHYEAAQRIFQKYGYKPRATFSYLKTLIGKGAIRIDLEADGIDIPENGITEEQRNTLKKYLRDYVSTDEYDRDKFFVETEGKSGRSDYGEFNPRNTDSILRGIDQFYKTGKFPELSRTAEFHYSLDATNELDMDSIENDGKYSIEVTNPETLDMLNRQIDSGDIIRTYKSFLEYVDEDGNVHLIAPMAGIQRTEDGKKVLSHALRPGVWEESVGNPNSKSLVKTTNKKGETVWKYKLEKSDVDSTVPAAFNPYQHSSDVVLNDQFAIAYKRPQLVTYECIIPKSELTSGYWFEAKRNDGEIVKAKDPVGKHSWKSGIVAGKLKETKRSVYLTRWLMPVEKVSDAEVARQYKEILDKESSSIAVPYNVVPPGLLTELVKIGVPIDYNGSEAKYSKDGQQAKERVEEELERESSRFALDYSVNTWDNEKQQFPIWGDPLYPKSETKEWHELNRQIANKTTGMKTGETREFFVTTLTDSYIIYANGFLSGKVIAKYDLTENWFSDGALWEEYRDGTYEQTEDTDSLLKSLRTFGDGYDRTDVSRSEGRGSRSVADLDQTESENDSTGAVRSSTADRWFDSYVKWNRTALLNQETLDFYLSNKGYGDKFNPNYAQAYIAWIHPDQFLRLTTKSNDSINAIQNSGWYGGEEELSEVARRQPIQLTIDNTTGEIYGHEGRHRVSEFEKRKITRIPVLLFDSGNKYDKEPIESLLLVGQFNNKYQTLLHNVIPLNEAHRAEIEKRFVRQPAGEDNKTQVGVAATLRLSLASQTDEFGDPVKTAITEADINNATTSELSDDLLFTNDGRAVMRTESGAVVVLDDISEDSEAAQYYRLQEAKNAYNTRTEPFIIPPKDRYEHDGRNLREQDAGLRRGSEEVSPEYQEGALRRPGSISERNAQGGPQSEEPQGVRYSLVDNPQTADYYPYGSFERAYIEAAQTNDLAAFATQINKMLDRQDRETNMRGITDIAELVSFLPMSEEERRAVLTNIQELGDKYGWQKPSAGKKQQYIIPAKVDKHTRTMRTTQNIAQNAETEWLSEEMLRESITNEALAYVPNSDKKAVDKAYDVLSNKSYKGALNIFNAKVESGERVTKDDVALGEVLLKEAEAQGDVRAVMKLAADLTVMGHEIGQALQAYRILNKLTPRGQMYYLQKVADKLNKEYAKKIARGKMKKIVLDPAVATKILAAQTREELDAAIAEAQKSIADQIPVTFADRWNAWRYLAMLGNPRTHIRNLLGNGVFAPAVFIKDVIARGLENKFVDPSARTKMYGANLKKDSPWMRYAEQDAAIMQEILTGNAKGNKFTNLNEILSKRDIWGTNPFGKTIDKLANFNDEMLNKEDAIFLNIYYKRSLAEFLQARGVTEDDLRHGFGGDRDSRKLLNEARTWAIREAQRNTYRDANGFASTLNQLKKKNKVAYVLLEGLVPFTKTPANIAVRGFEYSPLGLIKSIYEMSQDLKAGVPVSETIDKLAAGMTGTAIALLGFLLAGLGHLRGAGPDDEKEREFEELQGHQNWSLEFGGISYTIDWMAPAALPLFIGCSIYEMLTNKNDEGLTFSEWMTAMSRIIEPMSSLTMLDGINSTLRSIAYSQDRNTFSTLAGSMLTSYLGQGVPTLFGQIARSIDSDRRTTYVDKNSKLTPAMQRFIQSSIQAKIPGWANQRMAYVDMWGRTDSSETAMDYIINAFENFISPGYINKLKTTDVDEELNRLYHATSEGKILPTTVAKYFPVNGERKDLTAKEYETLAKTVGQTRYAMLQEAFNTEMYQSLSDDDKLKVVENIYSYADDASKFDLDPGFKKASWIDIATKVGATDYCLLRSDLMENKSNEKLFRYLATNPELTEAQVGYLIADKYSAPEEIRSVSNTGYVYTLDEADEDAMEELFGELIADRLPTLKASEEYRNASGDEQGVMLNNLYAQAQSDVKEYYGSSLDQSGRSMTLGKASAIGKEAFHMVLETNDGNTAAQAKWIGDMYRADSSIHNPAHTGYDVVLNKDQKKQLEKEFRTAWDTEYQKLVTSKEFQSAPNQEYRENMIADHYSALAQKVEDEYAQKLYQSGKAEETFGTPSRFTWQEAYAVAKSEIKSVDEQAKWLGQKWGTGSTITNPDRASYEIQLTGAQQAEIKADFEKTWAARYKTMVTDPAWSSLTLEQQESRIYGLQKDVATEVENAYARKLTSRGYYTEAVNLRASSAAFNQMLSAEKLTKEQRIDLIGEKYLTMGLTTITNPEAKEVRYNAYMDYIRKNYDAYIKHGTEAEFDKLRSKAGTASGNALKSYYHVRRISDVPGYDYPEE